MGLQSHILAGSQPEDIIQAVFGHMKENSKFNPEEPLSHTSEDYISDPSLSDQAFRLVYTVDATSIHITDDQLIDKLRIIRQSISDIRIPQVIVMTKVDKVCSLVKKDLKKVYANKRIKETMQLCCEKIGVPMN